MASVILHSPFSVTARIHNPNIFRPLSPPSFPTISFRSSSSPLAIDLSSRINRRFAVPRRRHEWEVGCLEIESEIGIEVQENEQLLGSGGGGEELGSPGLLTQMKEIVTFTGPAIGLWICGPLMSLIDTAVIGQGSAVELAALGILLNFLLFFSVMILKALLYVNFPVFLCPYGLRTSVVTCWWWRLQVLNVEYCWEEVSHWLI